MNNNTVQYQIKFLMCNRIQNEVKSSPPTFIFLVLHSQNKKQGTLVWSSALTEDH